MQKVMFLSLFFLTISVFIHAQDSTQVNFNVDYTTEIQTNFQAKYNWVNLLSLSAGISSKKISKQWENGTFHIQTISTYKLHEQSIAEDLLTFSNIEVENMPLNFFILGYTHQWEKFSLFGGIRNVNRDYFITPYTSLFTNSSAGILPTIASNFPLANYPYSAMSLHAEYQPTEKWLFKTSFYNGVAHEPRKNVFAAFKINPREDGIFNMSALQYTTHNKLGKGTYVAGATVQALSQEKETTFSLWGTVEQAVFSNKHKEIGFLLHGCFAPKSKNECFSDYAVSGYVAGLLTSNKDEQFGIYLNEAFFHGIREQTMELTWQYPVLKQIKVQPTFHCLRTSGKMAYIGMVRVLVSI